MVKNLFASAGDVRDRFLSSGGHGSPVQQSCLEDHMNRGA